MRKSRKLIAILATLALLATLLVPMVTPAAAGSKAITSLGVVTTKDDTTTTLGDLLITTVAGAAKAGHTVTLRFPSNYKWDKTQLYTVDANGNITGIKAGLDSDDGTVNGFVYDPSGPNALAGVFYAPESYGTADNAFKGARIGAKLLTDNELQIKLLSVDNGYALSNDGYLYVYTKNITIPAGATGEIKVVATAPGSQGFPSGEAVVGKIVGGEVYVSVDEVKTFTDTSSTITLRFKESVANSFATGANSMKLRLPNGFKWSSVGTPITIWGNSYWAQGKDKDEKDTQGNIVLNGDGIADLAGGGVKGIHFDPVGRDLYIKADVKSGAGTYFSLPVTISVDDESIAKYGDVKVTFSGDTDAIPSELVIAKYNDMGSTVTAANTTTVVAGKVGEEIGDIIVQETAPGTFAEGRTITLTLPSYAKWSKLPDIDYENNIKLKEVGFVGSDGRAFKWQIDTPSSGDPGKITFKDAEIILSGDASGNVEVEVSGTAGATGKVTVAEIKAPVSVSASSATEVKIGMNNQACGSLTITELKAEAIDNKDLTVTLPAGVSWSDVPKIEVTEGDIDLDEATTDGSVLTIPVKATSTTPATIKLSDIRVDIDRTVAEGDIYAKVGGPAVNAVNVAEALDDPYDRANPDDGYWYLGSYRVFRDYDEKGAFPNVGNVAKAAIAKVVTPSPFEKKANVVFKINDTNYTVNGVAQTMDVAPYIKDGRTFVPVRYAAQAVGVTPENILYSDGKVTLIKGDKVVQLIIGSNVMTINGIAINMDVAAEISNDRTMLPFRWVAQALGAKVSWDEATQTVTMEL